MSGYIPLHTAEWLFNRFHRDRDMGGRAWCGRCHHVRERHSETGCTGTVDGDKPGNKHRKPCPCPEFSWEFHRELVEKFWPERLEE